jgi:hypothetical protein
MIGPLGSQSKTLKCEVFGGDRISVNINSQNQRMFGPSLGPIDGDLRFELAYFVFLNASR